MKKTLYSLLIICTVGYYSCDEIDNPIPENTGVTGVFNWDDSSSADPNDGKRFVLVEEFTGHTCPNCPKGSALLQTITNEKGGAVIPVSIHAGNFAEVKTTGNKYTTDFNTAGGSEYDETFEVEFYPSANIGRIPVNNTFPLSDSRWRTEIDKIINTPSIADIDITNRYDDSANVVETTTIIKWNQDFSEPLKFQIFFLETKIIDWQDSSGVDLENYVHKHVLRQAIPNVWGSDLAQGVSGQSDTIVETYNVPENVLVLKNASTASFIYKPGPDYEIMQVNEAHILSE